jgi:uncharacterized SAM-dependent methyltransferase
MAPLAEKTVYIPIDVSASALEENCRVYNCSQRGVSVRPFVGTFEERLPETRTLPGRKTILFMGSSLGNYSDEECRALLGMVARCMNVEDRLLLGVDTPHGPKKPASVIEAAYNDAEGITADFTLNALDHVNRIAGLDFCRSKFRHVAVYDQEQRAIITHVEALEDQTVRSADKVVLHLSQGERIFVEQSRKFSRESLKALLEASGLSLRRSWTTDDYFLVVEATMGSPRG